MDNKEFIKKYYEIKEDIDNRLTILKIEFENYGTSEFYYKQLEHIQGMVRALEMMTGLKFDITLSGLNRIDVEK